MAPTSRRLEAIAPASASPRRCAPGTCPSRSVTSDVMCRPPSRRRYEEGASRCGIRAQDTNARSPGCRALTLSPRGCARSDRTSRRRKRIHHLRAPLSYRPTHGRCRNHRTSRHRDSAASTSARATAGTRRDARRVSELARHPSGGTVRRRPAHQRADRGDAAAALSRVDGVRSREHPRRRQYGGAPTTSRRSHPVFRTRRMPRASLKTRLGSLRMPGRDRAGHDGSPRAASSVSSSASAAALGSTSCGIGGGGLSLSRCNSVQAR